LFIRGVEENLCKEDYGEVHKKLMVEVPGRVTLSATSLCFE
jgi:hypothetical protein